jgi:hypothetical protein
VTELDGDRDGVVDSKDCAPLDAAIHPGAADLPDLALVDSDCDGIDGQEAKAVLPRSAATTPTRARRRSRSARSEPP